MGNEGGKMGAAGEFLKILINDVNEGRFVHAIHAYLT